jgi:signal-transduction protein with cAMP-binding, CBS, and nucleotidyltransferase domain
LYTFKKDDFLDVIEKYPNLGDKFQQRYKKRASDTPEHKVQDQKDAA